MFVKATIAALLAVAGVGQASLIPTPSPMDVVNTTTEQAELTYKRTTTKRPTTENPFHIPAPITDPAPQMFPAPAILSFPSPEPGPSPTPFITLATHAAVEEPAPETTFEPLQRCENTCFGKTCDHWVQIVERQTCASLESNEHCDCSGCSCKKTYSCNNACSRVYPTCSCEATCEDDGNCCDDFSLTCSDADFQNINETEDPADNMVYVVVGVGVGLLIVGAVGGFFVTRKILLNQRIKRENILLKQGNANIDTSYSSPKVVTSGKRNPNSEFSLL